MIHPLKDTFEKVAAENYWFDAESLSGPGSNLSQTKIIREHIPPLLRKLGIKKMMDAPCGDYYWMKEIKNELSQILDSYIGVDIVPQLVETNNANYSDDIFSFREMDITQDHLPGVELIFTRDCLIHLSHRNNFKILKNYKRSKARYLLVSTYTKPRPNMDVLEFSLTG